MTLLEWGEILPTATLVGVLLGSFWTVGKILERTGSLAVEKAVRESERAIRDAVDGLRENDFAHVEKRLDLMTEEMKAHRAETVAAMEAHKAETVAAIGAHKAETMAAMEAHKAETMAVIGTLRVDMSARMDRIERLMEKAEDRVDQRFEWLADLVREARRSAS